jgi:hypothetical protein
LSLSSSDFSALVCITTCRRLPLLRRYLPHYAAFCVSDPRFSLLVALDGTEHGYLDFCKQWDVPLLHSAEREGVGVSKNRVLERFPDFDYYFFIEDDVELVDWSAFPIHIELSAASGIHHLSLFERGDIRKPVGESMIVGRRVVHARFGSADFNFFTRDGLQRVGGWHPLFARYRRWGHTEHSYRFTRAGLAPAPFNVAVELIDSFAWHAPPTVSQPKYIAFDANQIALPEQELMAQELDFVPVETLSPHQLEGSLDIRPARLAATLDRGERYPLVDRNERRESRSDFRLWQSTTATRPTARTARFVQALVTWPRSPAIRHTIKTRLGRWAGSRTT